MKTIVIWSRSTDRKILAVFGFLCCILFAAGIGFAIPVPLDGESIRLLDAFITTTLLVLVWAAFRLVRPVRFTQAWAIAEFIAVPVIWICLVTALGLWFGQIHGTFYRDFDALQNVAVL